MDEKDSVLSHQTQIVSKLVSYYSEVTVITGRVGEFKKYSNLRVINSEWEDGENFRNTIRFLSKSIPILIRQRPQVIFSHMTEVQSFLISLVTFFLRIRHFLWYAHTTKSFYLQWNHIFLNGIITSTLGSCPIVSKKIHAIGQGVDSKQFPLRTLSNLQFKKLVHIGRFDRSKNISWIIKEVEQARKFLPELNLTLIGSPSNYKEKQSAEIVLESSKNAVSSGWLNFQNSIPRSEAPKILNGNDVFIHAYKGSLDKTLVEATLIGLPVVTVNLEYQREFGLWGKSSMLQNTLAGQIYYLNSLPTKVLASELKIRRDIAVEKHSLENWIEKIIQVLD